MKKKELKSYLFIGLFGSVWIFVIIMNLVKKDTIFSQFENRYLQGFPEFTWERLVEGEFAKDLDVYVNEQFIFRNEWIGLKNRSDLLLGKTEVNGVYIGRDGFLIEKHTEDSIDLEQLEKNTIRTVDFIKKYNNILGQGKIKVLLVPTASNVLVEKLPRYAKDFDQLKYLDSLEEKLKEEKLENDLVQVEDILYTNRNQYIYYKTDHHWTTLGAYYGYMAYRKSLGLQTPTTDEYMEERVSSEFYGTLHSKVNLPIIADDIYIYRQKEMLELIVTYPENKVTDTLYDMEKLETKDKYAMFLSGNHSIITIENKKKSEDSLLVIKDSYAHSLIPFLASDYKKIHVVDLRYYNGSIQAYIKEHEIDNILVLYNVINFITDKNSSKLLN